MSIGSVHRQDDARRKPMRCARYARERGGWWAASLAGMRVLRQVIAQRREHHVVDSVRTNSTARGVHTGPRMSGNTGILRAPLEAALGSIVDAVAEANGALKDGAGVAVAVGERSGNETIRSQHSSGVDERA